MVSTSGAAAATGGGTWPGTGHHESGPHQRHLGQAAARGEPGQFLSYGQARDIRAGLPECSGYLQARAWPGGDIAAVTAAGHHVEEVDPGVRHVDGHFTWPRTWLLNLADLRAVHSLGTARSSSTRTSRPLLVFVVRRTS